MTTEKLLALVDEMRCDIREYLRRISTEHLFQDDALDLDRAAWALGQADWELERIERRHAKKE